MVRFVARDGTVIGEKRYSFGGENWYSLLYCLHEIIPLSDDIGEYMKKNVLPYNPLAFLDRKKDKIGYEIPFTRLFYKFTAPQSSEDIFAEIKALEEEETALMKELFGNA